jgi:hypothetical protein
MSARPAQRLALELAQAGRIDHHHRQATASSLCQLARRA